MEPRPDANESRSAFLLNHLISEELPVRGSDANVSNSDPITGQAAWYDVRVRITCADAAEPMRSEPQFEPMRRYPGMAERPGELAGSGGGDEGGARPSAASSSRSSST